MKYLGSKARIVNDLKELVCDGRKPGQFVVDPFCGGCNFIDRIPNPRYISDSHYYLIAMWDRLVNHNWDPPSHVSEDLYKELQHNPRGHEPWLVGFVGFGCSFGAKWFAGYARGNTRNYALETARALRLQADRLQGSIIEHRHYQNIVIPDNSIIYCDPPYNRTTEYDQEFNSSRFWDWVRQMIAKGHRVYVSEYQAPSDFVCIYEKPVNCSIAENRKETRIEKLFTQSSCLSLMQKLNISFED